MASIPAWFDYETYMANKLAQMQKTDPAGNWTVSKLVDVFAPTAHVIFSDAAVHRKHGYIYPGSLLLQVFYLLRKSASSGRSASNTSCSMNSRISTRFSTS